MPHFLSVRLLAPLPTGDLVAAVTLRDGHTSLCLISNGYFEGEFPAEPTWFRLTTLPISEAEHRSAPQQAETPSTETLVCAVENLYEQGIAIPSSGLLSLSLFWGVHCHRELGLLADPSNSAHGGASSARTLRFGSFEHITTAERVGLGDDGLPLVYNGITAGFDRDTFLRVAGKKLTFGEIVALGGDYYAHLDSQAASDFAWAWPEPKELTGLLDTDYRNPTLADDDPQTTADILRAVDVTKQFGQEELDKRSTMIDLSLSTSYPLRRYLALASQNFCHFASQPYTGKIDDTENAALRLYFGYHLRALREAEVAGQNRDADALFQALTVEAFGCHFLSDLFATGHIRTPRRILGDRYGVYRGALGMSHEMHCEDNRSGLWLTTRGLTSPRIVWRGYGDDQLLKPQSAHHLWFVQRAVARSVAEVFARFCGVVLSECDCAVALIPIPLPAGQTPQPGDILPDGQPAPQRDPNSFPRYCWIPERQIVARRVGPSNVNLYVSHDEGHTTFALP